MNARTPAVAIDELVAESDLVGTVELDNPKHAVANFQIRIRTERERAPELLVVRQLHTGQTHTMRLIGRNIPGFVELIVKAAERLVPALAEQERSFQERRARGEVERARRQRHDEGGR